MMTIIKLFNNVRNNNYLFFYDMASVQFNIPAENPPSTLNFK